MNCCTARGSVLTNVLAGVIGVALAGVGGFNLMNTGCVLGGSCDSGAETTALTAVAHEDGEHTEDGSCCPLSAAAVQAVAQEEKTECSAGVQQVAETTECSAKTECSSQTGAAVQAVSNETTECSAKTECSSQTGAAVQAVAAESTECSAKTECAAGVQQVAEEAAECGAKTECESKTTETTETVASNN